MIVTISMVYAYIIY